MKILYSTGNRLGGGEQLRRYMEYNRHEIKTACYLRSSENILHTDWTLDALTNKYSKGTRIGLRKLYGYDGGPHINLEKGYHLKEEIKKYDPDLIICDGEPIVSNLAKSLGKRLWYCSPLHLLDGIEWESGSLRYFSLLDGTRKMLYRLPRAERVYVYSPFGDINFRPLLKSGYEWMQPYYVGGRGGEDGMAIIEDGDRISQLSKQLNSVKPYDIKLVSPFSYNFSHLRNYKLEEYKSELGKSRWLFTTGETSYVADGVYNGKRICIAPNLRDAEGLLNAILIKRYNLGNDVGQIEYMKQYGIEILENSYKETGEQELSKQDRSTLDEAVEQL
ncbi:MAG: hypothetical protein Q8O87_04160 [bacterium]|nr:hypothetical protein [bacterium]